MNRDCRLKVLCLHGHPGSSEAMQIFVKHFQSRGVGVLSPDLRGYGNCKAISPFTMFDHIQDLWDLLVRDRKSAPLDTEYLILGWSLGGILAMELAIRAFELQNLPEERSSIPKIKIVGLILIATAAKPQSSLPRSPWWEYVNLVIAVMLHLILSKILPKSSWHIDWFGKRSIIKYLIKQHRSEAYTHIATTGAKAYLQTSRYAQMALMQSLRQGYDRNQDLYKIKIPCLVIAAEEDRHITAAASEETAKLLPNNEFICYPNTAHLLPWEIGGQILANIDDWCDRYL